MSKHVANDSIPADATASVEGRPSREEARDAVRTLIKWAGDDPDRSVQSQGGRSLEKTTEPGGKALDEAYGAEGTVTVVCGGVSTE